MGRNFALTFVNRATLGLALAALTGGLYPASAGVGAWADGAKASGRIIAAGIGEDGHLAAGIEIILPPGWKTYWRYPGDAGIPPQIDFSSSVNIVDQPSVSYPAPHRFDDGYSVTNVYEDRLLLPVSVAVADPGKPVRMEVTLNIGVCEQICIPDTVTMALDVPPAETDTHADGLLREARADLPGAPQPGQFSVVNVKRDGGTDKRPVYRIEAQIPDEAGEAEVFVEAPYGWYPGVPEYAGTGEHGAAYRVAFTRGGAKAPIEGSELVFVIVSGGRSIEQTVTLD